MPPGDYEDAGRHFFDGYDFQKTYVIDKPGLHTAIYANQVHTGDRIPPQHDGWWYVGVHQDPGGHLEEYTSHHPTKKEAVEAMKQLAQEYPHGFPVGGQDPLDFFM